jgi:regulator of replication initiation timing
MHYGCGGLSEQDFKRILPMNLKKWKCPDCKSAKKGSSTSNSPGTPLVINERLDGNVDNMPSILSIDTEALMNNMNAKFAQLTRDVTELRSTFNGRIDGLANKIENWSSKFLQLEGTIRSMRDDINGISNNNDEIRAELSGLRSETAELRSATVELRTENQQLRKNMDECDYKRSLAEANVTITKLIKENNTSKQFSMMNNLEISGIPFNKGESLLLILRNICVKVGFTLQDSDVDSIHRVRRFLSAENSTQKTPRPPAIVVRFTQRKRKDELLSAVRARRGITTADIELPGPASSVYIGDHLTPDNKLLLKRAREIKSELHYSYLWIRDCRILMRKKDNTRVIYINSHADLDKLQ